MIGNVEKRLASLWLTIQPNPFPEWEREMDREERHEAEACQQSIAAEACSIAMTRRPSRRCRNIFECLALTSVCVMAIIVSRLIPYILQKESVK